MTVKISDHQITKNWEQTFGTCKPNPEGKALLTQREFDDLGEYSCSIPTGTTIGKKWKKNQNAFLRDRIGAPPKRILGEYVNHPDPELVGIRWREIEIVTKENKG